MPHNNENQHTEIIPQKPENRSQKHRRNREIAIAFVLVVVIFFASWGQTSYFGSDSWYFLVLLNLNGILMVLFFYLTVRNVLKLISERRRKVFGSRLRTRLLLAFGALSLIPIFLMYLAANRVIITSIDYWFTNTVSTTMDAALELGQDVHATTSQRLSDRFIYIHKEINQEIQRKNAKTTEEQKKIVENYFNNIESLLNGNLLIFAEYKDEKASFIHITPNSQNNMHILLQGTLNAIPWESLQDEMPYTNLITIGTSDFALAGQVLHPTSTNYIIIAELIASVAHGNLATISQGFEEYSYLKALRRPLRLSFSLILGLLGLIMVFSAIFMAFRLSKELTAPIEALAKGTSKIAHGELDVLLEDKGEDELGQLVSSFNAMATEVRATNQSIQHANLALESRNLFIENVLENINTGVCVFTLEGEFLSINNAACEIFGIDGKNWINKNPITYLESHEKEIFEEILNFLKKNPSKRWRQEQEFKRKQKTTKIFINALILPRFTPLEENTEKIESIILLIEDITELSRIERLGAWREVAKRIAHEMKNPLTPISLSAQRLERKFGAQNTDPAFKECTQLILTESSRMQEMITNFTNFAKMPEVQLKEENIVTLLNDCMKIFKATHTNIAWILDFSQLSKGDNNILMLHAETFKQSMMNIYLNACEILENKQNPQIITKLCSNAENYILSIEDNGESPSEEVLANMFEPYFTRKNNGTGLGLAIVQSIFIDHKATIYAENNQLGGLSIIITFPKIL